MGKTNIEFADKGWSPIIGCPPDGTCQAHCWARALHDKRHEAYQRLGGMDRRGHFLPEQYRKPFSEIQFIESRLTEPLHWKKPQVVFVAPQSDLFHEEVRREVIHEIMAPIHRAPQHTYLLLTKRAQNMQDFFTKWEAPENVWLGVSVCGPEDEDKIYLLCETPAAHRWISYEPALRLVDWKRILSPYIPPPSDSLPAIECLVAGCESGPTARPSDSDWFRACRDACSAAGVVFHLKQMRVSGRRRNVETPGKVAHLPYLDGRQHTELPWRVRG